jgi:hypothetical protein
MMVTYLHYGSASCIPMQTVRFAGTKTQLWRLIQEARRERWPLRVQRVEEKP